MDQEPNASAQLSAKFWLVVTILFGLIVALVWFGGHAWFDYAKNSLLWDEQKTATVTYSALAIPFALMVWFGVYSINKLPDSVPDEKRKSALHSLVVQPFGWGLLLLAYTLSEMRGQWHVAREIYFTVAAAACALMAVSFLVQFRLTKVKSAPFSALIWTLLFFVFLYRFIWGGTTNGLFK